MRHLVLRTGLFLAATCLLVACATEGPKLPAQVQHLVRDPAHPVVTLSDGMVRGTSANGVEAFKAIRYAAPPVGHLRWRAPQKVTPWAGIYDATHFRHDCMQKANPYDSAPLKTKFSEDCLFINVWAPSKKAGVAPHPVMVWIYGGGMVNGGTSSPVYDGTNLAKKGVILVSFNYRLGHFGFFDFPALDKQHPEEAKGNFGFMDQIAALEWVKAHIAAFGGDPDNVTVFGESAGGESIHMLLTSPAAKGLFSKAIIESGGGRPSSFGVLKLKTPSRGQPSLEQAGVNFAEKLGVQGTDEKALDELRALPADKICDGLNMNGPWDRKKPTFIGWVQDPKINPVPDDVAYKAGEMAHVPLMIGANSADLGFMPGNTMKKVLHVFGHQAKAAEKLYDPEHSGNVRLVAKKAGADLAEVEPARFTVRAFAGAGLPVFEYRFSYVSPSALAAMESGPAAKYFVSHGAQHASEIPYVFDTIAAAEGDKLDPADEKMADAVSTYWVNFATYGDPSGRGGVPVWPAYTAASDQLMNFTMVGPEAMTDPWQARLDLISGVAENLAAGIGPHL